MSRFQKLLYSGRLSMASGEVLVVGAGKAVVGGGRAWVFWLVVGVVMVEMWLRGLVLIRLFDEEAVEG